MSTQAARRPRSAPARLIQSVGRAMDILMTVARANRPLSPSEAAARLRLERTTVHRLMVTMATSRLLRFDPLTRKYRIGVGAFELGTAYLRAQIEDRMVERIVAELADEVGYTVSLGALVDQEVIIMIAREAGQVLTVNSRPGDRLPPHASAIGKLFLAERSDAEIRRFFDAAGMPRLTPHTISSIGGFMQDIARVRATGIAYARQEALIGVSSMAVPVRRSDGLLVAGLVVAPPAQFATDDAFAKLLPPLRRSASRIEAAAVVQPP